MGVIAIVHEHTLIKNIFPKKEEVRGKKKAYLNCILGNFVLDSNHPIEMKINS